MVPDGGRSAAIAGVPKAKAAPSVSTVNMCARIGFPPDWWLLAGLITVWRSSVANPHKALAAATKDRRLRQKPHWPEEWELAPVSFPESI